MNIILLRQYNPYFEIGASANRYRGLIDGLCRLGHSVSVVIVGGMKQKEETELAKRIDTPNFIYLSRSVYYNYFQNRFNTYVMDRTIKPLILKCRLRKLLKYHYDFVWITNGDLVLKLFNWEKKFVKGKTLIELNEFNDIYKEEGVTGNFLQRRKEKNRNDLFLRAVRQVDLFAVMTNRLIDYYSKLAKQDACFLHLPMTVDVSRFSGFDTTTNMYIKPYIAFTGTMNNQKDGVDILIKAFAQIAEKFPKLHLYLAGFWHYDVKMQDEMIIKLGLKDRIHRIGVLNREQIPDFVGNATLLALSRPDSHQAQGGFPTKLGEYLATGNPVCVTKVGEIPDYLEDNYTAFMAKPGDVDSFADAMDRALSNVSVAKKVGENGRKLAESCFNVDVQSKRLVEFLEGNLE